MAELIEVPAGLNGVAVTATKVGDVLGDEGFYHYRGRSATDLARTSSFEDVAALVLDEAGGPAADPAARALPAEVAAAFNGGRAPDLRSAISLLGAAIGTRPAIDLSPAERRADAVALISALPTLVASVHHRQVIEPRPELGHAADYLRMVTGVEAAPEVARALETYLILAIDHGFNSSTFTARVVASTGADVGACVAAGFCALTGPRHGAVQTRILDMFDAVAARLAQGDDAETWMKGELAAGRRLLGFGHAVYRTTDPRSVLLAEVLAAADPARHAIVAAVEEAGVKVLAGRRLRPNVDLYSSMLLDACGLPRPLFTATFAVSRVVGWCAHILEQAAEPKVIRPAAYYIGPPPRH